MASFKLNRLHDLESATFDEIIDVRSPAEFAADHLPGAINLPVLSDIERSAVGTLYKQVSPFDARKRGAALIARNSADHLQSVLHDRDRSWRPLIYCWRGGQRSQAFATILSQIGWRTQTLDGGYKSWRRLVTSSLEDTNSLPDVILLDGNTGTAKTQLLELLQRSGLQTLDLEALANHRGSLFGSMGTQPGQRLFEGRLAHALSRLDREKPTLIEAESVRIGHCRLPAGLWKKMRVAPRILVEAPIEQRAAYLIRTYGSLASDTARLLQAIDRLRPYQPALRIRAWKELVSSGALFDLARELLEHHYDGAYTRHRSRNPDGWTRLSVECLSDRALPAIADELKNLVEVIAARKEQEATS